MYGFSLRDAIDKVAAKFYKTSCGRVLAVTTEQKEDSLWTNVTWAAAVEETALASPDADGSIEICDLIIAGEKKNGGAIVIHFDDGTNEKTVVSTSVNDSATNISVNLAGKVQGWQSAILYYTVTGTFTGSITLTFIKHNKANSKPYTIMAQENGW